MVDGRHNPPSHIVGQDNILTARRDILLVILLALTSCVVGNVLTYCVNQLFEILELGRLGTQVEICRALVVWIREAPF